MSYSFEKFSEVLGRIGMHQGPFRSMRIVWTRWDSFVGVRDKQYPITLVYGLPLTSPVGRG